MTVNGVYVLVVSVLLSVSSLCSSEKTTKVCVIPAENVTCSCLVSCHTSTTMYPILDQYCTRAITYYGVSTGTHVVKKYFSSWNRVGLYLVGRSDVTVEIDTDITSWFSLSESSNISFTNLNFELISSRGTSQCKSDHYIF
ncbi:hypothetical protein GBAR_LOCUS12206, partial [Geodia barretti]